MSDSIIPLGKLPPSLMAELLSSMATPDKNVLLGPGPGLDCAVLDLGGETLFVLKNDPITFTASDLGWYLVAINANDIATTGATPRWLMATFLFPESQTTEELVRTTLYQLQEACSEAGITIIGGHTEVTQTLDRPIAVGTLIGEVPRTQLVTPAGAKPGDVLMLTKSVAIEAVAILCAAFPDRLKTVLGLKNYELGLNYHRVPGISVVRDAEIALKNGIVNAMHDPTEGGLATALWELADASATRLVVDPGAVPVSRLAGRVCQEFGIDPLGAISSGALLLSAPESEHNGIEAALRAQRIPCTLIGSVYAGPPGVSRKTPGGEVPFNRPVRDEIARLFDQP